MTAALVSIAECVLADYQAANGLGRLSQPIRARRGTVPEFKPGKQKYDVNEVFVSAGKETSERLSRHTIKVEYVIEVGLCTRLHVATNETVDPLLDLTQQMADFFFDYGLSNEAGEWVRNEVYFWGDKERLKFDGTFFALWDLVFHGTRSKP